MNKASGGDGIPVELFQILKGDAVKVLHSICQQIWKTQQWAQDWKMSVFIPIPKKGNAKECSNYLTIALISHTSKVMLKILQAKRPQYMNRELPDVQAGFRKGRGTRDQIANIRWIMEKAREFQRIARRDKEAFLSDQCKEIEENSRMGKMISFQENQRYKGNISCKDGHNKGQKWYGPNRSRRYSEEVPGIPRRTIQKRFS